MVDFDPTAPIDRDRSWKAKRKALSVLFSCRGQRAGELLRRASAAARAWICRTSPLGLCWRPSWAAVSSGGRTQHPDSPAVAQFQHDHARGDRVRVLASVADRRAAGVGPECRAARRVGLGIMHDLAVGVHPAGGRVEPAGHLRQGHGGRSAARSVQPERSELDPAAMAPGPARRDRLCPFRDMVATILRHAGGIRVDHVIGLFRLWWIPDGSGPTEGTYVRYDHEAMIGILALEGASRRSARRR